MSHLLVIPSSFVGGLQGALRAGGYSFEYLFDGVGRKGIIVLAMMRGKAIIMANILPSKKHADNSALRWCLCPSPQWRGAFCLMGWRLKQWFN